MKRFYSPRENFAGSTVSFDEEETRHIRDVIRLKEEDIIAVFDGEGREVSARLVALTKKSAQAVIVEEIPPAAPESPVRLELAAAMLKSDKFDITVQKAVELGVDKITPLRTARCDIKSKDSLKRTARWRKIALEASKQCGRAVLMEIADPMSLEEYLNALNAVENEMRLMFVEENAGKMPKGGSAAVVRYVIGPEGGWEDLEVKLGRAGGFTCVTLGGRIMRAETAAIAITAILQNQYGDLN